MPINSLRMEGLLQKSDFIDYKDLVERMYLLCRGEHSFMSKFSETEKITPKKPAELDLIIYVAIAHNYCIFR